MDEWISVNERLPEEGVAVLAWFDDPEFIEVAWQHNSFWFNGYELEFEPTHWQPLPPAPSR